MSVSPGSVPPESASSESVPPARGLVHRLWPTITGTRIPHRCRHPPAPHPRRQVGTAVPVSAPSDALPSARQHPADAQSRSPHRRHPGTGITRTGRAVATGRSARRRAGTRIGIRTGRMPPQRLGRDDLGSHAERHRHTRRPVRCTRHFRRRLSRVPWPVGSGRRLRPGRSPPRNEPAGFIAVGHYPDSTVPSRTCQTLRSRMLSGPDHLAVAPLTPRAAYVLTGSGCWGPHRTNPLSSRAPRQPC